MHSIPKSTRDDDLNLMRAVVEGSIESWHAFIHRYTPVIYSVLHRYLGSTDQIHDVYAEVLDQLYHGKLATYEGRAALSTWLVFITRSITMDYLRRQNGRQLPSRCFKRLSPFDRRVFTLFFEQDRTLAETRSRLAQEWSPPPSLEDVVDAVGRVHAAVDVRTLKRLPHRRRAESLGLASARLLNFLEHWKAEQEGRNEAADPEALLLAREARERALRILALTGGLSPAEQRLLDLRFEESLSAREIADLTPGSRPRQIYRRLYRLLAKLRGLALRNGYGESPDAAAERPLTRGASSEETT